MRGRVVGVAVALVASTVGWVTPAGAASSEPSWTAAQRAGGIGSDDGNAIAASGAKAPISTGNFTGTAYFPKSGAADDSIALTTRDDSQDVFIAALDAGGAYYTWAQRAGGPGTSVAQSIDVTGKGTAATTDDTVVVTGFFDGTAYFPTSAVADDSIALQATGGGYSLFVAALRPGGTSFAWAITGTGSAFGNSVALQGDDTAFVAGYFYGTLTVPTASGSVSLSATAGQDAFVAAIHTRTGVIAWVQQVGSSSYVLADTIDIAPDGSRYLTGSFMASAQFPTGRPAPDDSITLTAGLQDVFVAKMNADDSTFAWAQRVGGTGANQSGSVAADGQSAAVVTGSFAGTTAFPTSAGTSITLTSAGADDVFIAGLNADDSYFAWAQRIGGSGTDLGQDVSLTADDTPVVTGQFAGTVSFPLATGSVSLSAVGTSDAFVSAVVPDGSSFLWAQRAGGAGATTRGIGVATTGDDTTFVTGDFTGTVAFPGVGSLVSSGSKDVYVSTMVVSQGSPAPTPGPTPAPAPVYPPSAPTAVTAVAGDASATVVWSASASAGSFPVTTYSVTSSPAGGSCLTSASSLTCDVSGLMNGTTYTFTVRALNGAGWSTASQPSAAVTPAAAAKPSVVITGTRLRERISIAGKAMGFGMGGTLRPWLRFPGQSAYSEGSATIPVSMDGTFEWGRRTSKRVSVYVATPDGSVKSNVVTIR